MISTLITGVDIIFEDDKNLIKNNTINSCADRMVDLFTITSNIYVTWYKTNKINTSEKDWGKISSVEDADNCSVNPILQLVSGPTLNNNSDFIDNTKHWATGNWKVVEIDRKKIMATA